MPFTVVSVRTGLRQVAELVVFYRRAHRPGNVALVAGDFNIGTGSGPPTPEYRDLATSLCDAGLDDLWVARNGTPGITSNLNEQGWAICPLDPRARRYCDDLAAHGAEGQRIDYLFLERPNPRHKFVVDVTRPRRLPFPTPKAGFLSDHLGLEVTLVVTPRLDGRTFGRQCT